MKKQADVCRAPLPPRVGFSPNRPRQDARERSRDATVSRSDRGTDSQSIVPTIAAGRFARSDLGPDPRGAVEIRWRAVSDQTAFRFPVSPGGFSKQMSASPSVKSGSGAYLGPRSAVYRLLQAQHKVRELLRPLLRLGRLTLLEQTQSEGESRGGTGSRSARARLGTGGGGIGKNRTAEDKAVLSIVWFLPRAGGSGKAGAHMC